MFTSDSNPRRENDSKVELMQMKLKTVSKVKVSAERQVFKLTNVERSLCEELYSTKAEIDSLTVQLEDLKDKISDTAYQIATSEVQKEAERSKTESHLLHINNHRNGFKLMFTQQRNQWELRQKELRDREAEKQEEEIKKQEGRCRENERYINEAKAIEEDCIAVERECAVLKKRNAAIMLKLRKKLIETEDARRELLTRTQHNNTAATTV